MGSYFLRARRLPIPVFLVLLLLPLLALLPVIPLLPLPTNLFGAESLWVPGVIDLRSSEV